MKKRILSCVLVLCLLCSLVPMAALAAGAEDFTDVATDAWYYDYVDYVAEQGYYQGVGDNLFDPDGTMTRAMFVVVLSRIAGAELDNSTSTFEDVPADQWYTGAVAWAVEAGITNGTSSTTFSPDTAVTRQDMCVFMDRFIDWYEGENTTTTKKTEHQDDTQLIDAFGDAADIASYATSSVEACRVYGLVEGYQDGNFYPLLASTRAEIAAVIYRLTWTETAISTGGGSNSGGPSPYTYTITYYINDTGDEYDGELTATGYSASNASKTKTFEAIAKPATFVNTGYEFVCWNTERDGSGTNYYADDTGYIEENTSLYAVWLSAEDLIGTAVYNTIAAFNDLESGYEDNNGSSIAITAKYSNDYVGTIRDDASRTQYVTADGTLTADTIDSIIYTATTLAINILNNQSYDTSVITDVVKGIVAGLLGDDSISDERIANIASAVLDSVRDTGSGWVDNFYGNDGWYTGDVTITAEGGLSDFSIVYNVNNRAFDLSSYGNSRKAAAQALGLALAKDFYHELAQYDKDYVYAVSLEATVTVEFQQGAYSDTDNYPYIYPVEITLNLTDDSKTVGYMKLADDTDSIKLNLASYQTAYEEFLDDAVMAVSTAAMTETVPAAITSALEKLEQEYGATIVIDSSDLETWVEDNITLFYEYYANGTLTPDNTALDGNISLSFGGLLIGLNADDVVNEIIEKAMGTVSEPTETRVLLDTLSNLRAVYTAPSSVAIADIVALLTNTVVTDYVDSFVTDATAAAWIARLEALLSYLPENANITIDGEVLNTSALKGVTTNAKLLSDVCDALASALNDFADSELTVANFTGSGQNIKIETTAREITINLVIDLEN